MDDNRVSLLREIGLHRLVGRLGDLLAATCVLGVILAGCVSPTPTGRRDAIVSESSPADSETRSAPRFADRGPDADDYGASEGYPIGDRSTFFRIPFLVGSQSHFDQIFEGRLIRRATTPSPLARVNSEPSLRYEFGGETRTHDDYLGRNPATGLLIARGDTIDPHRALPVRPERSASLHLVVDGQDRHLHAGRHCARGRPHPLGR